MNFKNYIKYSVRFTFLQIILTSFVIYYFDRYLINEYVDGYVIIINSLIEDRNRFYPVVNDFFIKIDIYLALFIFLFLITLYSTKFFTYVNELTFSIDRKFFDEYLNIYLLWTSSLMTFLFLFRFSVVSRYYLVLLTFIVPLIIQVFRNTELLSTVLGRSLNDETFITFNLGNDSVFRNLRIMTFRKNINNFSLDLNNLNTLISDIDNLNKEEKINLVIINLKNINTLPKEIEDYLLNLNKKILLISDKKVVFNNLFIKKEVYLNSSYLTYLNNDIQYGSRYILKRVMDLVITIVIALLFLPVIVLIALFISYRDGLPVLIKQRRVGLHGLGFDMYKFRTMYVDSHLKRESLKDLNKNDEVIFKIQNDPRIFKGGEFLRKFSLDELPQLINVFKGEMSLVGPRPLFKEDTKMFDTNYMRRLNVLPGLTGLLQINDRNTDEFNVWYQYDMEYINGWSLFLDLKILLKTPVSIFKNKSKGM
jgi:lipopolysaccharide/colanic/teichoic acid biosynthesis glycosyltransferase